VTASWGSPYPPAHRERLRTLSFSSEQSEDSPIHQLEIHTPFLRPPPDSDFLDGPVDPQPESLVSATVLANRARRPAGGLTEEWIRQHTSGDLSESRHWLSDGTGDSEHSSLSGSQSGNEAGWLDERHLQTPRANPSRFPPRRNSRRLIHRASLETLRQPSLVGMSGSPILKMATAAELDMASNDGASQRSITLSSHDSIAPPATPPRVPPKSEESRIPMTPTRNTPSKTSLRDIASTPRIRKKVPWKGKNIMVLLPRDDSRGKAGHAPRPLTQMEIERMFSSWEELGYGVDGFDLGDDGSFLMPANISQSRGAWPNPVDMQHERGERKFVVTLPDLNGKTLKAMARLNIRN
jgi:hypothetical protein